MLKRIIPFTHSIVKKTLLSNDIAVDCTAGNGHDTLFLATNAKYVYAFDIQKEALDKTKERLNKHALTNVTLIHDSHEFITNYDIIDPKVIMYNLGYLPGGDESITTSSTSTIASIKLSLQLIKVEGVITITIYLGHKEGKMEHQTITPFVQSLDSTYFDVISYKYENKTQAPYTIFIMKRKELPSDMF